MGASTRKQPRELMACEGLPPRRPIALSYPALDQAARVNGSTVLGSPGASSFRSVAGGTEAARGSVPGRIGCPPCRLTTLFTSVAPCPRYANHTLVTASWGDRHPIARIGQERQVAFVIRKADARFRMEIANAGVAGSRNEEPGTRSRASRTASPRGLACQAACALLCGARESAKRLSPPGA